MFSRCVSCAGILLGGRALCRRCRHALQVRRIQTVIAAYRVTILYTNGESSLARFDASGGAHDLALREATAYARTLEIEWPSCDVQLGMEVEYEEVTSGH